MRSQFREDHRRRDRHGRGQGKLVFPALPVWRTRREQFDKMITSIVAHMQGHCPAVGSIEFAVEEVPPSDPAPWEDHDVALARVFPRDRARGLADRIVVYRQPVSSRCERQDLPQFLHLLLAERVSQILDVDPEELL